MAVKFQDYYETLGVSRQATQADIQRAYRKLARQYHPDVNKAKDAEARFKQINEAYEVLKDPEKRQQYDRLGANWKAGQEFTPPPGWGGPGGGRAGGGQHGGFQGGNFTFTGGDAGDFSDFFEMFFGRGRGAGGRGFEDLFEQAARAQGGRGRAHGQGGSSRGGGAQEGARAESELTLPLEDLYHGTTRRITFQLNDGQGSPARTLEVKIPPGLTEGSTLRLKGQGGPGVNGGAAGDLLLHIHVAPHPHFELTGESQRDLLTTLPVTPWEAALGAKVPVRTLAGEVTLTLPPGTQSGQKLRLRGKGLPGRGNEPAGDLFAQVKIVVPKTLTDRERELFETLQRESKFDPRKEG